MSRKSSKHNLQTEKSIHKTSKNVPKSNYANPNYLQKIYSKPVAQQGPNPQENFFISSSHNNMTYE